ncbi:MAG TPA: ferrochelatase [Polyangiaceae bacterium]|nr:ferrochelatase [Polyangiaceae bacterium]
MPGAVLLVSHGTVDDLADLPAFLANVRRGRPPGPELVAELSRRYQAIGGRSPLNDVNAELAAKLARELGVPVRWSNRLWRPYVRDVLSSMAQAGATRVAVVPLAQHSAHVYEEDARRAAEGLGLDLVCAANWGRHPGLCAAFVDRVTAALRPLGDPSRGTVILTAHSLPRAVVLRGDPYESEVRAAAAAVSDALARRVGDVRSVVAFQSQGASGRGADGEPVEWLGPDLAAALDEAAARGDRWVVLAPIGFLADHVEILYDLDIEARSMAGRRHLVYARAASLNADDDLVAVLADVARGLLGHG